MLIKLTGSDETKILAALGCTSPQDFVASLTAFISKAETMATENVTLETLQASLAALEGKILTEARVKEIIGAEVSPAVTGAISTWAASESGKKIIGAEASRVTVEALAAVGTLPAKPAPIGGAGNDTPEQKAAALIAEGKFEEAWKADKNLRTEFLSAKSYAAFMRANRHGQIKITQRTATN